MLLSCTLTSRRVHFEFSESCRSLVSAFRPRRWERSHWSSAASELLVEQDQVWLRGKYLRFISTSDSRGFWNKLETNPSSEQGHRTGHLLERRCLPTYHTLCVVRRTTWLHRQNRQTAMRYCDAAVDRTASIPSGITPSWHADITTAPVNSVTGV